MRKLSVAFTAAAAILLVGFLPWKTDAQTSRGATNIPVQSQIFTPIQRAACGGSGPYCPAGFSGDAVRTVVGARRAEGPTIVVMTIAGQMSGAVVMTIAGHMGGAIGGKPELLEVRKAASVGGLVFFGIRIGQDFLIEF